MEVIIAFLVAVAAGVACHSKKKRRIPELYATTVRGFVLYQMD